MMRLIWKLTAAAVLACFCSGCFLAHVRESFGELGITRQDREVSLKKAVKDYHGHLMAGTLGEALRFVVPERQEIFANELRKRFEREKVVEDKIDLITYPDSEFQANVDVMVKYYEIPRYIVVTRIEREKWLFKGPKKWLLASSVSKPLE